MIARHSYLGLALFAGLFPTGSPGVPVVLVNSTVQVTVKGGEANNGLVPYDGYFQVIDLGTGEEVTWSVDPLVVSSNGTPWVLSNGATGGLGTPTNVAGIARSTSTAGGLDVIAETELVGQSVRSTFTFNTTGSLNGITFVFYSENDTFSASDDAASFSGSIAGGDLALFQFDTVTEGLFLRQSGVPLQNATLTLFGAGLWTAWGTALESGELSVLSSNGSNFATVGDLGLALAYSLSGTSD